VRSFDFKYGDRLSDDVIEVDHGKIPEALASKG
jgi:hypothetical protein